jgi:hypothetical protein
MSFTLRSAVTQWSRSIAFLLFPAGSHFPCAFWRPVGLILTVYRMILGLLRAVVSLAGRTQVHAFHCAFAERMNELVSNNLDELLRRNNQGAAQRAHNIRYAANALIDRAWTANPNEKIDALAIIKVRCALFFISLLFFSAQTRRELFRC